MLPANVSSRQLLVSPLPCEIGRFCLMRIIRGRADARCTASSQRATVAIFSNDGSLRFVFVQQQVGPAHARGFTQEHRWPQMQIGHFGAHFPKNWPENQRKLRRNDQANSARAMQLPRAGHRNARLLKVSSAPLASSGVIDRCDLASARHRKATSPVGARR